MRCQVFNVFFVLFFCSTSLHALGSQRSSIIGFFKAHDAALAVSWKPGNRISLRFANSFKVTYILAVVFSNSNVKLFRIQNKS